MQELSDFCRYINQFLAGLVVAAVLWRGIPLALDRSRWRDWRMLHRVLTFWVLAGYGIVSSWAAIHYEQTTTAEASGASIVATSLHLSVIVLCICWPHPVRNR